MAQALLRAAGGESQLPANSTETRVALDGVPFAYAPQVGRRVEIARPPSKDISLSDLPAICLVRHPCPSTGAPTN